MQNKKTFILLGILVIVVGGAAFIAGRMFNQKAGPLGFGMPMGNGDVMSVSIQITPAPELPTREPDGIGSFVERKDNSIVLATVSMKAGGGGVAVQVDGGSEGTRPALSGPPKDGPQVEVVITSDTDIYLETTQPPSEPPASGENLVLQQTVAEGSLDDLTPQSFVTVWGRKSGDRIIAEVLFISNPIMFKRP
jgi:hypothetical protein